MRYDYNKYEIEVRDLKSLLASSDDGKISSGVLYVVMDAGTKTRSTIYSDLLSTAKTNPVSRTVFGTDEKIEFYGTATSYDIFVADAKGNCALFEGVTPFDHVLYLDRSGINKLAVATFAPSDNTEVDTDFVFGYNTLLYDAWVHVTTADATETLSVGLKSTETAGDADGILAAVSVAATGIIKPYAITVGGTETYISSTSYGALMGPGVAGANTSTDHGIGAVPGHVISGANAKTLTYTGSAGSDTAVGLIYVAFKQLAG